MKHTANCRWILWLVSLLAVLILSACGTPTPPPTPTGTPSPTGTPAPRPSYQADELGVAWSSTFHRLTANPDGYPEKAAADAGAGWDRWVFEWNTIMDSGSPIWSDGSKYSYDAATSGDQNANLQVLGILSNLLTDRTQVSFEPDGTWQQFVEAVVSRYGSEVNAWEVGNEYGFMHGGGADPLLAPEEYAQALSIACDVVGDNGEPIVLGSPIAQVGIAVANVGHGWDQIPKNTAWEPYKDILVAVRRSARLRNCVDAIGIHSYARVAWTYYQVTGVDRYLREKDLDSDGDNQPDDPSWSENFWITESGITAQRPDGFCGGEDGWCVADDVQANYIIQQYTMSKLAFSETGHSGGKIFTHRLQDQREGYLQSYGLIDVEYSQNNQPR